MLDPHKTCLPFLHKFATKFLQQLKTLRNPKPWKRRKPNILFSRTNFQTSTFTSMEVPNQLKHVFQFLDSNGDGKLSPLELSQVLLSLGHVDKSTAAKEAKKMVLEMDRDGDGLVDIEEFMTVVSIDEEDDDLMDAFAMFDCDKNGLISVEELQRVLRSLVCDSCSIEECREMIKGVDRDGDGFVDFDEFRSMMKGMM
ncbi:putative calcium-binding protein CML25 [Camellia lanceoleosa]|uniref:Calcium-binding protein CML25 n=1 Tax=Camellia lanceoleosa TaxID=1840588 RepID=A0ACC0I6A2_9ERIC|nr:putative calcium-binding protein CML25 [Camellia lanceoleosa]